MLSWRRLNRESSALHIPAKKRIAQNSRYGENDFDVLELLMGKEKVRDISCFFVCFVVEKLLHLDSPLQLALLRIIERPEAPTPQRLPYKFTVLVLAIYMICVYTLTNPRLAGTFHLASA